MFQTTFHKSCFLHITDFCHYLLHFFVFLQLMFLCIYFPLNNLFPTYFIRSLIKNIFFLHLQCPFDRSCRDPWEWRHSVCSFVHVWKSGQICLCLASWPTSVYLHEGFIRIEEFKSPSFPLWIVSECTAKRCWSPCAPGLRLQPWNVDRSISPWCEPRTCRYGAPSAYKRRSKDLKKWFQSIHFKLLALKSCS